MGHSTGSGRTGNTAAAERYRQQTENFASRSERNPNNLLYSQERDNYNDLVNAARTMRANAAEYSGLQAAIALDDAREGDEVEITGNVFNGRYRLESRRDPLSGRTGLMFVQQDRFSPHAFGKNVATIESELGLVRGGRLTDRQESRVRILRRR